MSRARWGEVAVRDDVAYAVGLALGAIILIGTGYLDRSPAAVHGNDFSGFWAGPRAFLEHHDPYDAATWRATAIGLGTQTPDTPVYGYLGWALVLLLPLAALPLELASAIWTFGAIALAALAMRALLREFAPDLPVAHTLVGLTLLASHPAQTTALEGQWGFMLVAASAAILVWARHGRTWMPALVSVVLLAKPQLLMLAAPAVAVWSWASSRRRFVFVAAAAALTLILLSVALVPQWPGAWLREMPSHRLFDPPQTTTLAKVLYGLIGAPGSWLAIAVVAICASVALRFDPASDAWLAVWLALSPLAALYVWSYDHLLLVVPLVIAIGVSSRRSRRSAIVVAAVGALILVVATALLAVVAYARNDESYNAVVPLLIFILVTLAVWPERRALPAAEFVRGYRGGTA